MKKFKMKQICENATVYQTLHRFAFEIGYSHDYGDEHENLIWISFMFWQIDVTWPDFKMKRH